MQSPILAPLIEHTLLQPTAGARAIEALCSQARHYHFHGVCVQPHWVRLAAERLVGSEVKVVSVAGFPHGANVPLVKAEEAALAVAHGASEIDVVANLAWIESRHFDEIRAEIALIRAAVPKAVLKVILETGYFDADKVARASEMAIAGGADFLKTSTGFGPRGATVEDIRLLSQAAAGRARIKAAGGISNYQEALEMVRAGASRIGTSKGPALVGGEHS